MESTFLDLPTFYVELHSRQNIFSKTVRWSYCLLHIKSNLIQQLLDKMETNMPGCGTLMVFHSLEMLSQLEKQAKPYSFSVFVSYQFKVSVLEICENEKCYKHLNILVHCKVSSEIDF